MKFSKKIILINVISMLIFIFIIIEISFNGILINIDYKINNLLPLFESDFTFTLSNILAMIFDTLSISIITLILCIYLWFKYPKKKESIFFASSLLLTLIIIFITKALIMRIRPLNALVNETAFSFPSGHVTTSVVFFGLLCYLVLRKSKLYNIKLISDLASTLLVLLIFFSRLFLNVHWFSDVLGGLFLGLFLLSGYMIIFEYFLKK